MILSKTVDIILCQLVSLGYCFLFLGLHIFTVMSNIGVGEKNKTGDKETREIKGKGLIKASFFYGLLQ